ncbi:hypothetical protein FACS1894205_6920 [Alphaproteobacteria bacterium]|nr:hypothetical protein FACS1894205_6920 [Alphaproteobacteria bacterium]
MNVCSSVRARFFLSHLLVVFFVSSTFGVLFYINVADDLTLSIGERLASSAAISGQMIDAAELSPIRYKEDVNASIYKKTVQILRDMQQANPDVAQFYILRRERGEVRFVVDGDPISSPALPGTLYEFASPNMKEGFSRALSDDKPYSDEWGTFLSGYAPLKNGAGNYLIGVDMHAPDIRAKYTGLRVFCVTTFLVSIALAALLTEVLVRRFMTPVNKLVERCTSIAEGKLGVNLEYRGGKEAGRLVEAFNAMSVALSSSEKEKNQAFEALENSRVELEARIRKRTVELEDLNKALREEIAQRRTVQNTLQEVVATDELTKLLNRRAMMERLDQEISRHRRSGKPLSMIMIDLDRFKEVNDVEGHHAGDIVLKETAIRMKSVLRKHDIAARWGGDEFVVILPDTGMEQAFLAAEKVRENIVSVAYDIGGREIMMTSSLGVATSGKDAAADQLFKAADEALYLAKGRGRNRVARSMELPSEQTPRTSS